MGRILFLDLTALWLWFALGTTFLTVGTIGWTVVRLILNNEREYKCIIFLRLRKRHAERSDVIMAIETSHKYFFVFSTELLPFNVELLSVLVLKLHKFNNLLNLLLFFLIIWFLNVTCFYFWFLWIIWNWISILNFYPFMHSYLLIGQNAQYCSFPVFILNCQCSNVSMFLQVSELLPVSFLVLI